MWIIQLKLWQNKHKNATKKSDGRLNFDSCDYKRKKQDTFIKHIYKGSSGVHQIFVKPEFRLNPSPVNIKFFSILK